MSERSSGNAKSKPEIQDEIAAVYHRGANHEQRHSPYESTGGTAALHAGGRNDFVASLSSG